MGPWFPGQEEGAFSGVRGLPWYLKVHCPFSLTQRQSAWPQKVDCRAWENGVLTWVQGHMCGAAVSDRGE